MLREISFPQSAARFHGVCQVLTKISAPFTGVDGVIKNKWDCSESCKSRNISNLTIQNEGQVVTSIWNQPDADALCGTKYMSIR